MSKKHFLVLIVVGAVAVASLGFTSKALAYSINFFNTSPLQVTAGQPVTLTWETTGLTNCRISRAEEGVIIQGGGCGNVDPDGRCSNRPPRTSTYTLNCGLVFSRSDRFSSQVIVEVMPISTTPAPTRPAFINPPGCVISPIVAVTANVEATNACLSSNAGVRGPGGGGSGGLLPPPLPPRFDHMFNFLKRIEPAKAAEVNPALISTNINWEGRVVNVCESIIGGGRAHSNNISCRNTTNNWSLNRFGIRAISGTVGPLFPTITQDYGITCARSSFSCSFSRIFFGNRQVEDNGVDCRSYCDDLMRTYSSTIESCLCTALRNGYYRQQVRSKSICSSSHSDSQQVRVVQEARIDDNILRTDPLRPQILLNQFVNLTWSVNVPDSGVPTIMRCTPSIAEGGDGEGWTTGEGIPSILLDSLPSSGRRNNLSPSVTTTYKLLCRNIDIANPSCFTSVMASREVRVFTPDIREIPSFYDGFMRVVGIINNNLR